MILTPILYFEITVAILIAAGALCAKPEYALFLYGVALGFPDLAAPIGTAINLRLDDVLIVLFLARSIFWLPASNSSGQRKIIGWQTLFFLACVFSIFAGAIRGSFPAPYDTAKMIGCAAILLALPRVLQSERRLQSLLAGLMCGGIALVLQMIQRLGVSSANIFANFQELKNAATFDTWNPNTIGQAAILLVFSTALARIVFPKTLANKIACTTLLAGFAVTPALMFVRGTTMSIAAGFSLFLCLTRSWKSLALLVFMCAVGVVYVHAANPDLVNGATSVDLSTGDGFSHRFDRWEMAIGAIRTSPLRGQGFGQEWEYLSSAGSEGRAHNAYLSVWIELGLGGLALFVGAVLQFVRVGYSLYKQPGLRAPGALVLALTFAALLDSFGLPTLYWEKLPTIAFAIAIAFIGICERNVLQTAPGSVSAGAFESVPQLT